MDQKQVVCWSLHWHSTGIIRRYQYVAECDGWCLYSFLYSLLFLLVNWERLWQISTKQNVKVTVSCIRDYLAQWSVSRSSDYFFLGPSVVSDSFYSALWLQWGPWLQTPGFSHFTHFPDGWRVKSLLGWQTVTQLTLFLRGTRMRSRFSLTLSAGGNYN